jgi:hypothetical protein
MNGISYRINGTDKKYLREKLIYIANLKYITMKPLMIFGLFIMALIAAQFANAQTVDEVIEKNTAAMGGKEKLAMLNSVRMEGGMSVQGTDVSLTITKLHNVGSRTDISVMGTENYIIITAAKGFSFMPVFGQSAPQDMAEDQFKAGQNLLDLKGTFVDYKTKGINAELMGKETVDGTECYKIKATFKNGNVTDFYIDTKTDRLYKTVTKANINGEATDVYSLFTNYKQNADGYWFPYTTTNSRGETNFDKIETNIKVDEAIFK